MTVIIDIDHDDGTLDAYTATVTDSGQLSAEVGAALAGTTEGLQLVIDDTNALYGEVNLGTPNTSGVMRARVYVDPNDLTMASPSEFVFWDFLNSTGTELIARLYFNKSGSDYRIQQVIYNDSGTAIYVGYFVITNEPHYVEIKLTRASSDVAADGSMQLWIDGVSKETLADKDNYDRFDDFDIVRLGGITSMDATTSGTFFLDELVVNDDGGEIGPVAAGATLTVADGQHTHSGDSPHLSQAQFLVIADGQHTQTGDSPHLSQNHFLVVADGQHTQTGDVPHLSQNHYLIVADGEHIHTGDTITLSGITYLLVVQDGEHEHLADGIIIDTDEILLIRPRSWWPFWSQ